MSNNGTYNARRGAYKPPTVIIGEVLLILLGLMIGASLAFYLCLQTMPIPNQTTIYYTKP